MRGLYTVLRYS